MVHDTFMEHQELSLRTHRENSRDAAVKVGEMESIREDKMVNFVRTGAGLLAIMPS